MHDGRDVDGLYFWTRENEAKIPRDDLDQVPRAVHQVAFNCGFRMSQRREVSLGENTRRTDLFQHRATNGTTELITGEGGTIGRKERKKINGLFCNNDHSELYHGTVAMGNYLLRWLVFGHGVATPRSNQQLSFDKVAILYLAKQPTNVLFQRSLHG